MIKNKDNKTQILIFNTILTNKNVKVKKNLIFNTEGLRI